MTIHSPSLKLAQKSFFLVLREDIIFRPCCVGCKMSLEFICITCLIAVNVACPDRFRVRRLFVTYWKLLETSVPTGSCAQALHLSPEMAEKTLLDPVFHGGSSKHDRLFGSHLFKMAAALHVAMNLRSVFCLSSW